MMSPPPSSTETSGAAPPLSADSDAPERTISTDTPCPILVNSQAGALRSTAGGDEIARVAEGIGLAVEIIATTSPEEQREAVRGLAAAGASRVVVSGGDGTVALAVQELAHSPTALGILPQGTANNFATALRLPTDLAAALRVVQDGFTRQVDLGRVGDRYFTEAAGVGLFADALVLYGDAGKNPLRAAYVMLRMMQTLRAHRLRLTIDGDSSIERAVMCTAANTYRMGLGSAVAPGARLTDGELDMVIIGDLHRTELWTYIKALRAQKLDTLPKAFSQRAREIHIESSRPMRVHCDDQIIGWTPVTITAEPHALRVLVEQL